ncbi:MAG: Uncharacterized conserved protein, contains double-stranded beta-helix domain, partial [uncultured Phycisphaerae bacterium]
EPATDPAPVRRGDGPAGRRAVRPQGRRRGRRRRAARRPRGQHVHDVAVRRRHGRAVRADRHARAARRRAAAAPARLRGVVHRPVGRDRGHVPRHQVGREGGANPARPGQRAALVQEHVRRAGPAAVRLLAAGPGGVLRTGGRPRRRPDDTPAEARRGRATRREGEGRRPGATVPDRDVEAL